MRSSLSELGFITDRYNNDLMTNSNGLHLIDMCKSFDLSIVNGRFGDDKEIVQSGTPKRSLVSPSSPALLLCPSILMLVVGRANAV